MRIKKNIKLFLEKIFFCRKHHYTIEPNGLIYYDDIPECPICFNDTTYSIIAFLECDHWACSECIRKITNLKEEHRRCHMCREKFNKYPYRGEV